MQFAARMKTSLEINEYSIQNWLDFFNSIGLRGIYITVVDEEGNTTLYIIDKFGRILTRKCE